MKKTYSKKQIKEGLAELAAQAESDHEVQMARSELYKLSKYAIKLHDLLKNVSEKEGLQAWQQSYITKAADYIDAVYHDIEYEKSVEAEVGAEIDSAEAEMAAEEKIETAESKSYKNYLGKKLKEEIKFNTEPTNRAYFKIVKKPTGFRVILGFGGGRLTASNADHESGDLKPSQIKQELARVQRELNIKNIEPYDEKTEKVLSKL